MSPFISIDHVLTISKWLKELMTNWNMLLMAVLCIALYPWFALGLLQTYVT